MAEHTQTIVSSVELRAARKHAQNILAHRGFEHESLEDALTYMTAASNAGVQEVDALEIGTGLVSHNRSEPIVAHSYEEFFSVLDKEAINTTLSGVHTYLSSRSNTLASLSLDGLVYSRNRPSSSRTLVGVDEQYSQLSQAVHELFSYNPSTRTNPERIIDESAILLYGPSGTGKSSLLRFVHDYAQEISSRSGISVTHASFASHDYSMWVGESAKSLQRKFDDLRNPSGVGILVLEELDMLFEPRNTHASAGGQQVTSVLMQNLSGSEHKQYGNLLVIGSTNLPEKMDFALQRRFPIRIEVPSFSSLNQYMSLTQSLLHWPSEEAHSVIASYALTNQYSPANTASLCAALERKRRGPISSDLFDISLDKRDALRKSQYRLLSTSDIDAFLQSYSL